MANSWENLDQAGRLLREAQQARDDVGQLLREIARQRDEIAGTALWCSVGGHAFGVQDRHRARFRVETYDEDTGDPVTETHLACGPHAAASRAAVRDRRAILEAPPVVKPAQAAPPDPELYRQFLEWQSGMGPEPARAPAPDPLEERAAELGGQP